MSYKCAMQFIDFLLQYGDLVACMKYYQLLTDAHTQYIMCQHIHKHFDVKVITHLPHYIDLRVPGTLCLKVFAMNDSVHLTSLEIVNTPKHNVVILDFIRQIQQRVPHYYYFDRHEKPLLKVHPSTSIKYKEQSLPTCVSSWTIIEDGISTTIDITHNESM
jgi:hypothetical protein